MTILNNPEELRKIELLKKRYGGSEFLTDIEDWEREAKDLLLALSIEKSDGVQMLLKKAREEITEIDEILANSAIGEKEGEISIAIHNRLFDKKRMWQWFIDLFKDNRDRLDNLSNRIDSELKQ